MHGASPTRWPSPGFGLCRAVIALTQLFLARDRARIVRNSGNASSRTLTTSALSLHIRTTSAKSNAGSMSVACTTSKYSIFRLLSPGDLRERNCPKRDPCTCRAIQLTFPRPVRPLLGTALPAVNEMPNCLMLLPEFPPKNTAGVHRSLRFCQFLPEFGWQLFVLASNVSEPGGDQLLSKIPPKTVVTRIGPVVTAGPVNGKPVGDRPRRPAVYVALRRMLSPARQLMTETPDRNIAWSRLARKQGSDYLRSNSIDVLYSSGPPHSVHLAARKLATTFGIPWVADFRDPWARKPWTKKANPLGQYLLPFFERTVVGQATKVILNTQASHQDFCAAYPQYATSFIAFPMAWIRNWSSACVESRL